MVSTAVVLGGGGVTGIAWEIGVLTGLRESGVALEPDAVFGTSAGSFVGVALASGIDLAGLFAAQHEPAPSEKSVTLPRSVYLAWVWAYIKGRRDAQRIGAGFGAIARRRRPLTSPEDRRRAVEGRLVTTTWPETLHVTAINAETGELKAFAQSEGYSLVDAVSASGAVPGISPMVEIGGRSWVDGGMVSSANAFLAADHDQILVIAPLPAGHGGVPSVADEVAVLRKKSSVQLIVPDSASREAIGKNIYDASRRPGSADAGRLQGIAAASSIPWR
ncbi:patatin-like phospholipase family protein [Streptosporangium subroseum]|uniref:patatin-like phospholipase family protein n=1 Tax=Streptosporangium subroseum TaxID=106412 RepID=UPI00308B306F|nr:patatin-like phospholipase family protein [Streptosporangium subroseum]